MKYQSEIVKEIIDSRGHEKSSLHYQSECVETWIKESEGSYPKLCDYQSEWLNYINENPLGEFPYEILTDVTTATVNNVVPFEYKSAILKGSTLLVDELGNECEIPNSPKITVGMWINTSTGVDTASETSFITGFLKCPTVTFIVKGNNKYKRIGFYDKNKKFISGIDKQVANNSDITIESTEIPSNAFYLKISASIYADDVSYTPDTKLLIEDMSGNNLYSTQLVSVKMPVLTTSNEDGTKTNILTVNEDVELGSVGEVKDELNLLTGQLTQRTETRAYQEGDESNSEVITDMTNTRYKLPKEVIKTVDLSVTNQDGEILSTIKPLEGTMHITTSGTPINPLFSGEIPVEAIIQNLNSFIRE